MLRKRDDYVLCGEHELGLRGSGLLILHDKTWISLTSDSLLIARERCLELSNWMSVLYKMSAFTTQSVVIGFSERTSNCPEQKALQKISPQKTHRNTHDEGKK